MYFGMLKPFHTMSNSTLARSKHRSKKVFMEETSNPLLTLLPLSKQMDRPSTKTEQIDVFLLLCYRQQLGAMTE